MLARNLTPSVQPFALFIYGTFALPCTKLSRPCAEGYTTL
jgi:hypothetical protein